MIEEAGKAASTWLQPRETQGKTDTIGDTVNDAMRTLSKVSEYWMSDPKRALEAQTALFSGFLGMWSRSLAKMAGDAAAARRRQSRTSGSPTRTGRRTRSLIF